jgi:hypothetical protein
MATSEAAARTALDMPVPSSTLRPDHVCRRHGPECCKRHMMSAVRDRYARQDAVQTGKPTAI